MTTSTSQPLHLTVQPGDLVRYSDQANPGTTYQVIGAGRFNDFELVDVEADVLNVTYSDLRQHGWTRVAGPVGALELCNAGDPFQAIAASPAGYCALCELDARRETLAESRYER